VARTGAKTPGKQSKKELSGRIIATDIDPDAIVAAKKNAATAGVEHLVEFAVCDFAGNAGARKAAAW